MVTPSTLLVTPLLRARGPLVCSLVPGSGALGARVRPQRVVAGAVDREGAVEAYGKALPVGRIGQGEDIAAAAAFLASEEAGYMTGQTISVNGGRYMGSA